MFVDRRLRAPRLIGVAATLLLASSSAAAGLDPASADLARPALDPAADAEIIRYDIRIVDGVVAQGFDRLIEINRATMVYTARGAESEGTASIPYAPGTQVDHVSVRVTGPDGRKRQLMPEKMIDQEVMSTGEWKLRRKTFVVPGLVPGSLVEVYSRIRSLDRLHALSLVHVCQEDVPIRSLRLRIRPWKEMSFELNTNAALRPAEPIATDADGYRTVVLRDVPAWHAEPWMPEVIAARPIAWGEYRAGHEIPRLVLSLIGRTSPQRDLRTSLPVVDSLAVRAAVIVAGAQSPAERAEKLFQFCHTDLRNLTAAADSGRDLLSGGSDPDDLRPWTTLRNRASSARGINLAFAGLAIAAGLDVRIVLAGNVVRGYFGQIPSLEAISRVFVAVSGPGGWQLFDPGDPVRPAGFVDPALEGVGAFMTSGGEPVPFVLPRLPAARSCEERLAELRLSPEGDAEGVLLVRWSGHLIGHWKDRLEETDREEPRQEALAGLLARWPAAEVDSFAFTATAGGAFASGWRCHVRIPAYATPAADLLLAPLDPFDELHAETLADSLRRHPVHWGYSWTERDRVRLTPPSGTRVVLPTLPGEAAVPGVFRGSCRVASEGDGGAVEFERVAEFSRPAAGDLERAKWPALRATIAASTAHGRLVAELMPAAKPGTGK